MRRLALWRVKPQVEVVAALVVVVVVVVVVPVRVPGARLPLLLPEATRATPAATMPSPTI
jgi:hypothetical protein